MKNTGLPCDEFPEAIWISEYPNHSYWLVAFSIGGIWERSLVNAGARLSRFESWFHHLLICYMTIGKLLNLSMHSFLHL